MYNIAGPKFRFDSHVLILMAGNPQAVCPLFYSKKSGSINDEWKQQLIWWQLNERYCDAIVLSKKRDFQLEGRVKIKNHGCTFSETTLKPISNSCSDHSNHYSRLLHVAEEKLDATALNG